MRILVALDIPDEADLLGLYLGGGDNEVVQVASGEALLVRARAEIWDVVLMPLSYPETVEQGFELFSQLLPTLVDTPLVMACRPTDSRGARNRAALIQSLTVAAIPLALLDPGAARTVLEQVEARGGLDPAAPPIAREGPIVRSFPRRQPREVTRNGRAPEGATPGQPH